MGDWFLCAVVLWLRVLAVKHGGRKVVVGEHKSQQCVMAAQECAGLLRSWMSNDAAPGCSVVLMLRELQQFCTK